MEKYGFVYIWYDKYRKMYYIGCRWGTEDDGYICSSNRMRDAYRRRPQDFSRKVVSRIYTNRLELLKEEYKWLLKIKPEELGEKYYNLRQHKWGHWTTDINQVKTIKEKLGVNKGRKFPNRKKPVPFSAEHREKIRQNTLGEKNPFYGKICTKDHRDKISKANTGRKWTTEQKNNLSQIRKAQRRKDYVHIDQLV